MTRKEISEKIKNNESLEITFPVLDDNIQEMLHFIVETLLSKYNRMDLNECVYSVLKELIINGIKANIKFIVFKENNINSSSAESLTEGLKILRCLIDENNLHELEKKAIENKLFVKLRINHTEQCIIAYVENNRSMTELEDSRIREKFKAALTYDSIADYYLNHVDDTEGTGLGITMIVLLLKGVNIDPHSFTISTDKKNLTIAKIEFPVDKNYILKRVR